MKTESLLKQLPKGLQDRTKIQYGKDLSVDGGPILYWMRNAARGHENPALNTLIHTANQTSLTPFVLHAITSVYPYASDRHHTFQLEGAIDVDQELTEKGIPHALYVEKLEDSNRHLREMVNQSALLIVEEIPIKPFSVWGKILAKSTETPILSVDTDCIVPMNWTDEFYNRAYKFRNAIEDERDKRINRDWATPELNNFNPDLPNIPFVPISPDSMDIPKVIATCNIDHGIGPVTHSKGGSSSGYDRWKNFREEKLEFYDKQRNTPSKPKAVSRLSPYLHYGHISPFKVASEAQQINSSGTQKFLDEFITWRELAHHYCFHHDNYNCFNALPNWAQKTLLNHADDPREKTFDWATLSRARTGDRLWDLCQESLLTHGELHNNVRMTWAKQLLHWTSNPRIALQMAIDLNNRYALDGRDPNSYGGIFWCFGLFDKPYNKDRSIIGKLRPRTTDWHKSKIDLDSFSRYVHRPLTDDPFKVAIVGAGIAGATATRILTNHRITVDCYEKSRGSGGRASTRRTELENKTYHFDHGAQYFTVQNMSFRRLVKSLVEKDEVGQWNANLVEINGDNVIPKTEQPTRYVAKPGMSSLADHIFRGFEPTYSTRVQNIKGEQDQLEIITENGTADAYDSIILTAPPKQSMELAGSLSEKITETCRKANFLPTWAAMLGFDEKVRIDFDGAFVNSGKLDWIARNSSKPGRPSHESWVLHATSDWSSENIDEDPSTISEILFKEWERIMDLSSIKDPVYQSAHRWRYARSNTPNNCRSVIDRRSGLILAGDWLAGDRIEGAFLSGRSAASRVLNEVLDHRKYSQGKLFD